MTPAAASHLCFEDAVPGLEIGPLVRTPTDLQLLEYAGASRDYNMIHHDRDTARASGLPDIIVQGSLKSAYLGQLVLAWAGEQGQLRRLSVQYRGLDVAGAVLTARGVVAARYRRDDIGVVECDLWLESGAGRTVTGRAVVALPIRHHDRAVR